MISLKEFVTQYTGYLRMVADSIIWWLCAMGALFIALSLAIAEKPVALVFAFGITSVAVYVYTVWSSAKKLFGDLPPWYSEELGMTVEEYIELRQSVISENDSMLKAFTKIDKVANLNPTITDYKEGLKVGRKLNVGEYSKSMWASTKRNGVLIQWNPFLGLLFVPSLNQVFSMQETLNALEKPREFIDNIKNRS